MHSTDITGISYNLWGVVLQMRLHCFSLTFIFCLWEREGGDFWAYLSPSKLIFGAVPSLGSIFVESWGGLGTVKVWMWNVLHGHIYLATQSSACCTVFSGLGTFVTFDLANLNGSLGLKWYICLCFYLRSLSKYNKTTHKLQQSDWLLLGFICICWDIYVR